jgi:hypothetical protein
VVICQSRWLMNLLPSSYAWGSAEDPLSIYIGMDGETTFSVTKNLGIALPYLRYVDKKRVLWIDAICVNQRNFDERGQQVQRMTDIFPKAKRVIVWLGPAADDSSLALETMTQLASKIDVDWIAQSMKPTSLDASDQHWADVTATVPYNPQIRYALGTLILRPWFERLWIWVCRAASLLLSFSYIPRQG